MYLTLLNTVKLSKGYNATLLINTVSNKYYKLPAEYYDAFTMLQQYSIDRVNEIYGDSAIKVLLDFLMVENLALISAGRLSIDAVPVYDEFGKPKISNAVLEVRHLSQLEYYPGLLSQLKALGCKHIVVFVSIDFLKFAELFGGSDFTFDFYIDYRFNAHILDLPECCDRGGRYVIYNCGTSDEKTSSSQVRYTKDNLDVHNHVCGVVSPQYFAINIDHYSEAEHFNTCLNRKVSIDGEGNIRNCPVLKQDFGNIKNDLLANVIRDSRFIKYGQIKKDDIAKCRDCEFRYVCTDCRAYLEDPDDLYSAPLKCGYDPYAGKWEEWSTNPMKQEAIEYYGMQELVKVKQ
jgi:SPASM domain peptide maturase of grasp-with-spasm system